MPASLDPPQSRERWCPNAKENQPLLTLIMSPRDRITESKQVRKTERLVAI